MVIKGFPRTVISTLISQVITKLNTGLNLLAGGSAVSSSNPLPVLSKVDPVSSQVASSIQGRAYKAWVSVAATSLPSVTSDLNILASSLPKSWFAKVILLDLKYLFI